VEKDYLVFSDVKQCRVVNVHSRINFPYIESDLIIVDWNEAKEELGPAHFLKKDSNGRYQRVAYQNETFTKLSVGKDLWLIGRMGKITQMVLNGPNCKYWLHLNDDDAITIATEKFAKHLNSTSIGEDLEKIIGQKPEYVQFLNTTKLATSIPD